MGFLIFWGNFRENGFEMSSSIDIDIKKTPLNSDVKMQHILIEKIFSLKIIHELDKAIIFTFISLF